MSVKAWREIVTIPTYETGKPEKNPMFIEKRVYQGSSGVVYPYPVIESISDEKTEKQWKAIYLENEYIKASMVFEDSRKEATKAKRKEEQLEKEKQQMLKTIGQLTLERDFVQDAFRRCGLPVPQFHPKDE